MRVMYYKENSYVCCKKKTVMEEECSSNESSSSETNNSSSSSTISNDEEEVSESGSSSEIDEEFVAKEQNRESTRRGKNGKLKNNANNPVSPNVASFQLLGLFHSRPRKAPDRLTLDFSAASGYSRRSSEKEDKKAKRKKRNQTKKGKKSSSSTSVSAAKSSKKTRMKQKLMSSFASFEALFVQEQHLVQRVIDRCGITKNEELVLGGRCLDHRRSFPPLTMTADPSSSLSSSSRNLISHIVETDTIDWQEAIAANKSALAEHQLYPLQVSLHGPVATEQVSNPSKERNGQSLSVPTPVSSSSVKQRQYYYLLPQPYSFYNHYYYSYPCEDSALTNEEVSISPENNHSNHNSNSNSDSNNINNNDQKHSSISLFEMPQFLESHLVGNSLPIKVHFYPKEIPELLGQRCVGYIFSYQRLAEDGRYTVIFPHRSNLKVEQKHPFELEVGMMNEEDEIIVDRLAKTLLDLL